MADKTFTVAELAQFDGKDASKPLYIAMRGTVFDVSGGRDFYGPGGPYEVFAGKECARALALMKIEESECTASEEGLDEKQLATLTQWFNKFASKYPIVGKMEGAAPRMFAEALAAAEMARKDEVAAEIKPDHDFPWALTINMCVVAVMTLLGIYILFVTHPGKQAAKEEL